MIMNSYHQVILFGKPSTTILSLIFSSRIDMWGEMQFSVFSHIAFLCKSFVSKSSYIRFYPFVHSGMIKHVPSSLHLFISSLISSFEYRILMSTNWVIFNDYLIIVVFKNGKIYIWFWQLLRINSRISMIKSCLTVVTKSKYRRHWYKIMFFIIFDHIFLLWSLRLRNFKFRFKHVKFLILLYRIINTFMKIIIETN